jgi:hypothetical protein
MRGRLLEPLELSPRGDLDRGMLAAGKSEL